MIESTATSREILDKAITARASNNIATVNAIRQDRSVMQDFILNLGNSNNVTFEPVVTDDRPEVMMHIKNGTDRHFKVHPHALYQIADKFSISQGMQTKGFSGYIRTMVESQSEWKTQLAAHMINEHVVNGKRERVLVREIAGTIKGVLSDQYKRMDTLQIFEAFFQASEKQGCQLLDAYQNDLKAYLEVIHPEVMAIPYYRNGSVATFDVVFGARISNSDFGAGSLELRNFMLQVKCLNGMVGETLLKSIHLGSKLPDDFGFSELTYKRETIAQASKVNDFMSYLMSPEAIKKQALLITEASKQEVDYETEFKSLVKSGKLGKSEAEEVVLIMTNNNPNDGVDFQGNSLWKLTQGITAYANRVDQTRKKDLQEIAGELLKRVEREDTKLRKSA